MDHRAVADLAITRGKMRFGKGQAERDVAPCVALAGSPAHRPGQPGAPL
jgi:hypothetical protein